MVSQPPAETKADKAARLLRELKEYRVETLRSAAHILRLLELDSGIVRHEALAKRDKIADLLDNIAGVIARGT